MTPPDAVIELVERFERNYADYIKPTYLEEQARFEFINPFFKALGWDMDNTQGYAEAYKDVLYESALKVGGSTKAPDYSFGIGPTRKFFLEAKRPGTNIETDLDAPYQLRTYAYTAQFPLSVLTNFRHLAVYDGKAQPARKDAPGIARLKFYAFRDYLEKWDDIAGLLARDSILKGAFDTFAAAKTRRGTASFDVAFLREIEGWREALAKHIAANNNLTSDELNFAVGRIIDRIIFLRICEERGIEQSLPLAALKGGGPKLYERLVELFRKADARYNSGLFHFDAGDKLHEAPDELTPHLKIGTKPLVDILQHLYYPHTSYAYDRIPLEILGQIYERFLGKVITLKGKTATVDEKPEVRKAGGVYYTPSYIVDYIVAQTVGKLIAGRTPQSAAKLKVLDPACGSGSFLLGAYAYLLEWHLNWYAANEPETHAKRRNPPIYAAAASDPTVKSASWRLTSGERKRILRDNIFGVDIDRQAVEVTKLSLLLKVLKGETDESISNTLKLFHERALPDLGDNIKCGNSLIGPDFYDAHPPGSLSEEEEKRLNVFDWHHEFAAIMKGGGFDAVIGNPPYGGSLSATDILYFQNKYGSKSESDTYAIFMKKAVEISCSGSLISMIVPTGWYSGAGFTDLRRYIACVTDANIFVNLPYDIFKAWVDTTIFVLQKRGDLLAWPREITCPVQLVTFPKREKLSSLSDFDKANFSSGDLLEWFVGGNDTYLTYSDSLSTAVLQKVNACSKPLKEFADVQRGVTPFNLVDTPNHSNSHRAFNGSVRRYNRTDEADAYIRYDTTLAEFKPTKYFTGPRLLLRELISRQFRLQATKADEDFVTNKSMQSILLAGENINLEYLLGVESHHILNNRSSTKAQPTVGFLSNHASGDLPYATSF